MVGTVLLFNSVLSLQNTFYCLYNHCGWCNGYSLLDVIFGQSSFLWRVYKDVCAFRKWVPLKEVCAHVCMCISGLLRMFPRRKTVSRPPGMCYFSPLPACRWIKKALCTARSKSALQFHFSTELNRKTELGHSRCFWRDFSALFSFFRFLHHFGMVWLSRGFLITFNLNFSGLLPAVVLIGLQMRQEI